MSDSLNKNQEKGKKNNLPVIIGSVIGVLAIIAIIAIYFLTGNKTLVCTKTVSQTSLKN